MPRAPNFAASFMSVCRRCSRQARCFVLVDDTGELEADALDELVQLAELGRWGRICGSCSSPSRAFAMRSARLPAVTRGPAPARSAGRALCAQRTAGYLQFRLARAARRAHRRSAKTTTRRSSGVRRAFGSRERDRGFMLRAETPAVDQRKLYFIAAGAAAALSSPRSPVHAGGGEVRRRPRPLLRRRCRSRCRRRIGR